MAYRDGTYVAFHPNGTTEPGESDFTYYNLLRAWNIRPDNTFDFVNSHEKTQSVRDSSKRETLRRVLKERLLNSKNMILIIGKTTREDNDWVPFELTYAIDECSLPIIASYTGYQAIMAPQDLWYLWPMVLHQRINNLTARVIHVPFKQRPLQDAVGRFDLTTRPNDGLSRYGREAYLQWGLIS